jgi:pimeloyl-ACP methyl ester carboxylesterase
LIHSTFAREPVRGRLLRGDVRIPEGPPPRSAVVVVHGFKGFKDWGFFPYLCRRLAAAGHATVSFNFSGSGIGSDHEQFTELEAFAANTFSRELEELAWVVDWVASGDLLPRRPRGLALVGHSRGGGDAILHAAGDPRVAALATWSAVSSFDRWNAATRAEWRESGRIYVMNARTGQQMPLDVGLLDDFEARRDELDVGAAAGRVEAPWLIVHGEQDLTVDVEEALALARVARRGRLLVIEGAGHTYEVGHPFAQPSRALDQAVDATIAHLALHVESGWRPTS